MPLTESLELSNRVPESDLAALEAALFSRTQSEESRRAANAQKQTASDAQCVPVAFHSESGGNWAATAER